MGIRETAEETGVSESTIFRRLRVSAFRDRISELRSAMISSAVGKLADAMAGSVDALRELRDRGNESVRLRASDKLLIHAIRVAEIEELQRRVSDLEERLHDKDTGRTEHLHEKLKRQLGPEVYALWRKQFEPVGSKPEIAEPTPTAVVTDTPAPSNGDSIPRATWR